MTIKLICAVILSFLFATAFGKYYIPWLRKQKAGQQIKSEVDWHKSKSGTPTMGGVMFIGGTALVCLTLGFPSMLRGRFVHIFVLLFAMVFGVSDIGLTQSGTLMIAAAQSRKADFPHRTDAGITVTFITGDIV